MSALDTGESALDTGTGDGGTGNGVGAVLGTCPTSPRDCGSPRVSPTPDPPWLESHDDPESMADNGFNSEEWKFLRRHIFARTGFVGLPPQDNTPRTALAVQGRVEPTSSAQRGVRM